MTLDESPQTGCSSINKSSQVYVLFKEAVLKKKRSDCCTRFVEEKILMPLITNASLSLTQNSLKRNQTS